jgi:hypothetical protein
LWNNQCEQKQLHARRSAGAGESKEIDMDKDKIIDGLRMTMDLFTFDPSTGEEKDPDDLNDLDRTTYDACKGALEILERLDTDSDTISRKAAIEAVEFGITYAKAINKETGEVIALFEESNAELKEAVNRIKQLPPAQPEQLEQCPIYGGMCAYPSNQCYDCPRHAGAKMEVTT